MGELSFSYADLYPNWGGVETGNKATPEVSDQNALNESVTVAEQASQTEASKKSVFLALIVFMALVIFFGGK